MAMAIDPARSLGAAEVYHDWKAEPLKLYVDLNPGFIICALMIY